MIWRQDRFDDTYVLDNDRSLMECMKRLLRSYCEELGLDLYEELEQALYQEGETSRYGSVYERFPKQTRPMNAPPPYQ